MSQYCCNIYTVSMIVLYTSKLKIKFEVQIMRNCVASLLQLAAKLSTLKMNEAPLIDQISRRILIKLSEEISKMVAKLFNKYLSTCNKPQDLMLANATNCLQAGKPA